MKTQLKDEAIQKMFRAMFAHIGQDAAEAEATMKPEDESEALISTISALLSFGASLLAISTTVATSLGADPADLAYAAKRSAEEVTTMFKDAGADPTVDQIDIHKVLKLLTEKARTMVVEIPDDLAFTAKGSPGVN